MAHLRPVLEQVEVRVVFRIVALDARLRDGVDDALLDGREHDLPAIDWIQIGDFLHGGEVGELVGLVLLPGGLEFEEAGVFPVANVAAAWAVAAFAADVLERGRLVGVLVAGLEAEADGVADDALGVEVAQAWPLGHFLESIHRPAVGRLLPLLVHRGMARLAFFRAGVR